MTQIYTKKFDWLPPASAWESVQNWREKHQANQDRADSFAATADAFSATIVNLGTGMAEIAAKRGNARVNAALQTKVSSINALV